MSAYLVSHRFLDNLVGATLCLPGWDRGSPLRWPAQPDSLPADLPDELRPPPSYRPDLTLRGPLDFDDLSTVGAMLLAENAASVAHRYGRPVHLASYQYQLGRAARAAEPASPVELMVAPLITTPRELLVAIETYRYQTCEHPGWYTSEARSFCNTVQDRCGVSVATGPDGL